MSVLVLLIFASLAVATVFLVAFIWAVRSGQYEDTCTPSMRVLLEDLERPSAGPAISTSPRDLSKLKPRQANCRVVAPPDTGLNRRS